MNLFRDVILILTNQQVQHVCANLRLGFLCYTHTNMFYAFLFQNLARNSTQSGYRQKADGEAQRKQQELEDRVRKRAWDIERNKEHESRKVSQLSCCWFVYYYCV